MTPLVLTLLLFTAAPEMELRTLDGQTLAGTLVELSAEQATLEGPAGRETIATEKLLSLTPKQKPAAPAQAAAVWIELVNGSTLPAKEYAVQDRTAKITLLDGQTLDVSTRDVAAVRLQASNETVDKEWTRILGLKHEGDVLVTRKEDTIDYLKGKLGDVSDAAVNFELDGEKIPVKRSKVFGVIYYHAADREMPATVCTLADAAGARWSVRTLKLAEQFELTTPCGLALKRPVAAVGLIDFSGGKILYLSDLKAESVQWTPYFGTAQQLPAVAEFYAPRMDQNLASKPLQLQGQKYDKGIALHSRTEMVYRLPGRFSRFKAVAGIDDDVAPNGNVRLVIRGDDKTLLETTIAGPDKPKPIDLDVSGVKRLTILVDFGEKLDVGDHLDLCLARISK